MLLSTATSPTTSPYLKVWKGVAPLSTTIVPNRRPKLKVRKSVAPLPLRSVPPSSPTASLSRKFGKVSLRYRFAPVPPSSPTATLNRKFGKVSLRYCFALVPPSSPTTSPNLRVQKNVAPQSSALGNHHQSPPTTLKERRSPTASYFLQSKTLASARICSYYFVLLQIEVNIYIVVTAIPKLHEANGQTRKWLK